MEPPPTGAPPSAGGRLVILDRDGVINRDSEAFIKGPEEWEPLPGSLEAVARLHRAGFRVVVATNQSGVGRGLFDLDTLLRIHAKMHQAVAAAGGRIEAVFYCPHAPEAGCACRKPRPGLLLEVARRLGAELRGVPVIGDALRDLEAARAVGARPILVLTGKGRATLEAGEGLEGVEVYRDLAEAAQALVREAAREGGDG